MEYKYTGQNNHKSPDLIIFGVMDNNESLQNGQILKIPDDKKTLIAMLDASGVFEKVKPAIKAGAKPVKRNKPARKED